MVAVLTGAGVACSEDGGSGELDVAAAPSTLPSTMNAVRLLPVPLTTAPGTDAGESAGHSLNLPQGWSAQVWANVPEARMAAWTPDGKLVVSTGQNGSLVLLSPNGPDQAPTTTTLLDGLDNPQGIAFTQDDGRELMIFGESGRIVSWDYRDGALSNRRVVIDGLPDDGNHPAKMVAVRDGKIAYNVGSATNRDPVDRTSPQRATIAEVALDGTGNQTLAVGVRNGEGLSFAPDGTLFTAVNQGDNQPYPFRDDQGDYGRVVRSYVNENPVEQVSRIGPGTDLGWPYCVPNQGGTAELLDIGYVNDPINNPDGDRLDCNSIGRTMLGLPAHSAPIGFVFTQGSALPESLSGGALITAHGSWNRQPPREPYVAYSRWDDTARSLTTPTVLVTGFQNADGSRWGRSVDAVPGPDGSIYVTDDAAGLVYRLTPPAE